MIPSRLRFLTLLPVFGYTIVSALPGPAGAGPAIAVGLPMAAIGAIGWYDTRRQPLWGAVFPISLLVAFVAIWASGSPLTGSVADLAVGFLLGLPLWIALEVVMLDRREGWDVLTVGTGLFLCAWILAALDRGGAGAPRSSTQYLVSFGNILSNQGAALAQLLQGAGAGALPLTEVTDPIFAALSLLAIFGLVLGWLIRSTEPTGDVAAALHDDPMDQPDPRDPPLVLTPELERTLDRGSAPIEPPVRSALQIGPLAATVAVAFAFLGFAAAEPTGAPLLVVLVAVAVLAAVALVARDSVGRATRRRPRAGASG